MAKKTVKKRPSIAASRAISLQTPLEDVSTITPLKRLALSRLGLFTVRDVLWTIPLRYEDMIRIDAVDTAESVQGVGSNTIVQLRGTIQAIRSRRAFRRKRLFIVEASLIDSVGSALTVTWFNQPYLATQFQVGDQLAVTGKVKPSASGPSMTNPSYERLPGVVGVDSPSVDVSAMTSKAGSAASVKKSLIPVYPLTAGITQKQFRLIVTRLLAVLPDDAIVDYFDEAFLQEHDLLSLNEAIRTIHAPAHGDETVRARMRLRFDTLLMNQMAVQIVKQEQALEHSPALSFDREAVTAFVHNIPFTLTDDQRRAAWQILQDCEHETPMNRLLIGDVGSGKTIVAAIAALNCVRNGYQVAVMAPTDILAQQHFETFEKLFAASDVQIHLLTSATIRASKSSAKNVQRKALTEDIVIGTHALIQETVRFRRLGLAIVDEQHRFGVLQRKKLTALAALSSKSPHFLSMSATPIPRTLALSIFGDVDITMIQQMPAGRKPVETQVIYSDAEKERLYTFMEERITKGEQCFVLCPLISDSEKLSAASVESTAIELQEHPTLAGARIAALHGKMAGPDKTALMNAMQRGDIDILVSTTVIEVGVDIPKATMMVVMNAERFGLAQLHQLRGRVGRRNAQSYCFVLPDSKSQAVHERLNAFARIHSGFELAEIDLKNRGAGDVYGLRQSGIAEEIQIAFEYPELLNQTHTIAKALVAEGTPRLQKMPLLAAEVTRAMDRLHFE